MDSSSTTAFSMYLTFYLTLTLLSALWIFLIISRYCRLSLSTSTDHRGPQTTMVVVLSTNQELPRGLETSIIESFPKFAYNSNMDIDMDIAYACECVVCLGVFDQNEMLRILPKCGHVFHADCIDAWLRSHATCPFCRANLLIRDPQADVIIDVHRQ